MGGRLHESMHRPFTFVRFFMVNIFSSLFSSWTSFLSSSTLFIPFIVLLGMLVALIIAIKEAFVS